MAQERSLSLNGSPLAATPLGRALLACRTHFLVVAAFSGVVNLLQLTVPLYMMLVFNRVYAARSLDTLLYLSLIALAALGIMALLEGVRGLVMQRVASWIEARNAPEGFDRAMEAPLRGLPYGPEALRDLATLRGFMGSAGALSVFDLPWVPAYLAVIFLIHPLLGWVALGGAVLLVLLTLLSEAATAKPLREAGVAAMLAQRQAEATARNAEVIDSMGMGDAVRARWLESLALGTAAQDRAGDIAALILAATKFARLAVQLAVLGVGAWLVLGNALSPGGSIAASIIMGRALAPVEQVVGAWRNLVQARQALQRLQNFLRLPPLRPAAVAPPAPVGALSVERVTFGFPGQSAPQLRGVEFSLAPGENLALVGPSAAGKTTLLRLLIGTLRPASGTVRLDGADVFLWPRGEFGRHLGYLPQAVELFDGTVFRNIARMGEAEPEAVFAAARLAGAHEMILRLPHGYDTGIGEAGQNLSAGQRQMVGLARALFGRPRLVVLDEPNANLDAESEGRLIRALAGLKQEGMTVVMVSHRPSLLQAADKILILRGGMVEAFGPRQEVMARLMAAVPRVGAVGGRA